MKAIYINSFQIILQDFSFISAQCLVDNSGNSVNHYVYDSFGNVVSQTGETVDTRYLYTGREWDDEIGLQYNRARYYNPALGIFISEDPISFEGGDANLFRYVDNNPLIYTDPLGLMRRIHGEGEISEIERLCNSGDCAKIKEAIDRLEDSIYVREGDRWTGGRRGRIDDGHLNRINREKEILRRCKDQYNRNNCNDDQDCKEPQPQPQPKPKPTEPPVLLPPPRRERRERREPGLGIREVLGIIIGGLGRLFIPQRRH